MTFNELQIHCILKNFSKIPLAFHVRTILLYIEHDQLFITPQVLLKYCIVSEMSSEFNESYFK